ncbi:LAQU0S15e02322g1_1 [Lachancea quebecensis]|uniref:LAQU0S15e02322g1_1 n=1 Tax=Lachancea quebecensis TaxID=1654605 RepID=A0A0P1L289_9SACH|nr:LAQU0S15e02322g1_1 [Lachancea quebecensis]
MRNDRNESSDDEAIKEEGFVRKKRKLPVSSHQYEDDSSENESLGDGEGVKVDSRLTIAGADAFDREQGEDDMFASDSEIASSSQVESSEYLKRGTDTKQNDAQDDTDFNGGFQMEAFNLEEESRTGAFDQFGNYTENPRLGDQTEEQDHWLDDYNDEGLTQQVKIAQKERLEREKLERSKFLDQKRVLTLDGALKRLLFFLPAGETALETLGRLNSYRRLFARKPKLRKNNANEEGNSQELQELKFKHTVNAIELITDLLDIIQRKGITDVYDLTRSKVEVLMREESLDDQDLDNYKTKLWCFKWLTDLATVNQGYTNYEMQCWKQEYFADNVIVKFVEDKDEVRNWIYIKCLEFM